MVAEVCILPLTTHYLQASQVDSHMMLGHLLVQDMIPLAQEMVHQANGAALGSQVAEVAALVGIRSLAMTAMTLFELT
jgi:hypothetical protein